jgi:putative ABC transport system permease protein
MSTTRLLIAEIAHRKMNFLLALLAVAVAATLFVAGPTIVGGYSAETTALVAEETERSKEELAQMHQKTAGKLKQMQKEADAKMAKLEKETKRIMRDLGFNLRIVHRDTDMTSLFTEFKAVDMPEEYIQRLAKSPELTKVVHLVASLKQKITWEGRTRLLVGFARETVQTHIEKKPPMGLKIPVGQVYLGYEAAIKRSENGKPVFYKARRKSQDGKWDPGEKITIEGKSFEVARILPRKGDHNDVMIAMNLRDAQAVLKKPGKITEILALGCKCKTIDRLSEISEQLEKVLPEAKVTEWRGKAIARVKQRDAVKKLHKEAMAKFTADSRALLAEQEERLKQDADNSLEIRNQTEHNMTGLFWIVTPLVVIACCAFVGLMTWVNVRERRTEIGLLRALGRGEGSIAALFLGKSLLVGGLGGLIGCGLGYAVAQGISNTMNIAAEYFSLNYVLLAATIIGAPLIAALAAYLPTRVAIAQDPAVVLMEQ